MAVTELRVGTRPAAYGRPSSVVLEGTARSAGRSAVLWGYVFGVFVASSAWSYASLYKTAAQRTQLAAAFGANRATIALFGPAPGLETVAGFTVFKISMTLMIIGGVWGLLTSTRLLRGEEDAGRWDVLLSGQTTRRGAEVQALGGFGVSALVLWALTWVITAAVGQSSRVGIGPGSAGFLALALVSPAVMFLAVGALTSQLAPTRRQAAGYAAAVLGASYGLRMVGDAGIGLHGLTWISPLGWVEELAPLTANNPWPLLLIVALTTLLSTGAVHLAGRRDVGSSVIPDRSERVPRLRLLGDTVGLGVRLTLITSLSWLSALALIGLLFGVVAKGAGATLSGSSLQETFDKLGATGGGVGAYLGVTFLMVAVLIGFMAATQVGAVRTEESEGRLDHLLVRPVGRVGWLAGRLGLALVVTVAAGVVTGLFTWIGVVAQPSHVDLGSLLGAGLNAVVPALFLLGLGTLLFGIWPRATSVGLYTALAWSFLVELVGGIGAVNHWVLDTSLFHHVASAPAVAPDWTANAVVVGCSIAAAAVGLLAFRLRDLVAA